MLPSSLVRVLADLDVIQFPANVPQKAARDGMCAWAPTTHVGDADRVLGSQFWPGLAPAILAIWAVNQ